MYRAQAGEMETEKEKPGFRGVGRCPGRRSGTNLHILYNAHVVAASGSEWGPGLPDLLEDRNGSPPTFCFVFQKKNQWEVCFSQG